MASPNLLCIIVSLRRFLSSQLFLDIVLLIQIMDLALKSC